MAEVLAARGSPRHGRAVAGLATHALPSPASPSRATPTPSPAAPRHAVAGRAAPTPLPGLCLCLVYFSVWVVCALGIKNVAGRVWVSG